MWGKELQPRDPRKALLAPPRLTCPYTARWLDRPGLCGSWEKSAGSGYISTPRAPKSWALATWGKEELKDSFSQRKLIYKSRRNK